MSHDSDDLSTFRLNGTYPKILPSTEPPESSRAMLARACSKPPVEGDVLDTLACTDDPEQLIALHHRCREQVDRWSVGLLAGVDNPPDLRRIIGVEHTDGLRGLAMWRTAQAAVQAKLRYLERSLEGDPE